MKHCNLWQNVSHTYKKSLVLISILFLVTSVHYYNADVPWVTVSSTYQLLNCRDSDPQGTIYLNSMGSVQSKWCQKLVSVIISWTSEKRNSSYIYFLILFGFGSFIQVIQRKSCSISNRKTCLTDTNVNKKNSEYDQEIPQSQTADKPVAPEEEPLNTEHDEQPSLW